jgi:putative ABC transport system permease protein
MDGNVLSFALAVSLVVGIGTGILTASQIRGTDVNHALKEGGRGGGRSRRRALGALVAGEVALTLMLLIGTSLMLQTVVGLTHVNPGYTTEKILTMVVTTLQKNRDQFHQEALDRVAALPGVKSVAFVWGLPLTGNNWMAPVGIEGRAASSQIKDEITVPYRSVTPAYFSLMGISIRDGRGFSERDKAGATPVAIINETMARRYFADQNPLGKRLTGAFGPREIIGVVSDLKNAGLNATPEPEVYVSFFQAGAFSKHLVVRTATDPLGAAQLVRRQLQLIDPGVVVEQIKTMDRIRDDSISAQRFATMLLSSFALVAVMLAVVGVYGVMSHEIGVRMAIGAQRRDVLELILRQGFVLAVIGIVMGLAGAGALSRALRILLFEINPADPVTFASMAVLLAGVILLACWLPARRATRIDPLVVLRSE